MLSKLIIDIVVNLASVIVASRLILLASDMTRLAV